MNPTLPTLLDLAAIGTAGLFGAAIAVQHRMPIVGVMLIGILSALGGGMLRDVLMGAPVVAMIDRWYLPTAVGAAVLGMPLARKIVGHPWIGLVLDGLVLGLFTVVGTEKAYYAGLPAVSCVFIGIATAVGGGMIVELLVGERPTVLKEGPWFATASLTGAVLVVGLLPVMPAHLVAIATIVVVAALRIWSERMEIAAPSIRTIDRWRNKRS